MTGDEWRIILDFLRRTDPALVARVGRRMLNHLSWSGVPEARALLQRTGVPLPDSGTAEENRPIDDPLLSGVWGDSVHRLSIPVEQGRTFLLTIKPGEAHA